jgi:transcriptional regulator with XRE-family HTH domain
MITPSICRAARALVGWTQSDLAGHAGISLPTVSRFERGSRYHTQTETLDRIRAALESNGVAFELGGALRRAQV